MNKAFVPSFRAFLKNGTPPSWAAAVLLFVLTLLTYGPSLTNGFLLDDFNFLPGSDAYHFDGFGDFFLSNPGQHYQPFYFLINTAVLETSAGSPVIPRAINLWLFFLCCLMVYHLVRALFNNPSLALLTAILYCVHPLNSISVLQISHSSILVYIILLGTSFLLFWTESGPRPNPARLGLGLLCYAGALLCFEGALFFPFVLTAGLVFLRGQSWLKAAKNVRALYFLSALFALLWLRMTIDHTFIVGWTRQGPSLLLSLQNYLLLVLWYLSRLVFPLHLVVMKNLPAVEPAVSFFALYALFFIAFFLLKLVKRNSSRSFALTWFACGLILIFPATESHSYMGAVLNPHWLSFYAIGAFVLIALAALELKKRLPAFLWLGGAPGVCLALFILTQTYVLAGAAPATFYQSWLRICPNNYVALTGLGSYLSRQGEYGKALPFYRRAARFAGTRSHENDFNLGVALLKTGEISGAKKFFIRSLRDDPEYPYPYHALGWLAAQEGRTRSAEKYFLRAAQNGPDYLPPRLELARLYLRGNDTSKAIHALESILGLHPPRQIKAAALAHLVALYYREKKPAPADRALTLLFQTAPGNQFYAVLTEVFSQHHLELIALDFLKKAIAQEPRNAQLYLICGTLLANHGQLEQAIAAWEEGSAIDPQDPRFEKNIREARALMK